MPTAWFIVTPPPPPQHRYTSFLKDNAGNPGRPVVSAWCLTELISAFIYDILQPIVRQLTIFIKDSGAAISRTYSPLHTWANSLYSQLMSNGYTLSFLMANVLHHDTSWIVDPFSIRLLIGHHSPDRIGHHASTYFPNQFEVYIWAYRTSFAGSICWT
jgi:hypothetical protein